MNFIEICAGCGGLSSGLIKAGFKPILLNDNDKNCCETLKLNHINCEILCSSFEDIDFTKYINKIDLLAGGVPCQSFSQAGLRKGLDDDRGLLLLKFIDIINIIKPKIFLIENVKGLLSHKNGKTFEKIIKLLEKENNYKLYYEVLNAFDYKVPQKRERIFIIGIKKEIKITFEFPKKNEKKILLKDVLYNVPESNYIKYSEEKINLFKKIPQGGCWINLSEEEKKNYLGNSFNSPGGKRGILYRLSMDKPSLTLLCSPSQKQTERCHPIFDRPLTIREYARIQTFDDDYKFFGSTSSQYKQIGNAIPVELARQIGEKIMESFSQYIILQNQ